MGLVPVATDGSGALVHQKDAGPTPAFDRLP